MSDRIELPGLPHRGVDHDELQIWRDVETMNVIFMVPPNREQVVFSPEQWDRAVEFLKLPVLEGGEST